MLSNSNLTAFLATCDAKRARTFYERTLGLRVVSDDDFALVLDANGTPVRLQKVKAFTPHPFTALGWEVADIEVTVKALREAAVAFERYEFLEQDALGIWKAPSGARIAWFKDPDGNVLSVSQH